MSRTGHDSANNLPDQGDDKWTRRRLLRGGGLIKITIGEAVLKTEGPGANVSQQGRAFERVAAERMMRREL